MALRRLWREAGGAGGAAVAVLDLAAGAARGVGGILMVAALGIAWGGGVSAGDSGESTFLIGGVGLAAVTAAAAAACGVPL